MSILDSFISNINLNKEILDAMPKNNQRDVKKYIEKLTKILETSKEQQDIIIKEIKTRYEKISKTKPNSELEEAVQILESNKGVLYLLNDVDTSYEKMDLDKALFNLNHYYSKKLEIVNNTILFCIKKFEEVGIKLELKDFDYSEYVKEYLKVFLCEMDKEEINSKKIKNKFDEIYWKCPDLIPHIVLNIKSLYLKYEKNIDKYYKNQRNNLVKNFTSDDLRKRFFELEIQVDKYISTDKEIITKKLLNGELNPKDYKENNLTENYLKFIDKEELDFSNENRMNELDTNLQKLLNSLYEYKKYLEYKFLIDDVVKIYQEKEKYKNVYANTLKIVNKKEAKREKLNKKIGKSSMFDKSKDKIRSERDSIINELIRFT